MDPSKFLPNLSDLGLGGELTTPIGSAIEKATSERLIGTDWQANIQICDAINGRPEGPQHAVKALRKRLSNNNPKVVQLTLTLCEACVKNCGRPLHAAMGDREVLGAVVAVTDGGRGWDAQQQALKLIRQWASAFQNQPAWFYRDAYSRLVSQGVRFPEVEEADAPVFTPAAHSQPRGSGVAGAAPVPVSAEHVERLGGDLEAVRDKVVLCRQMLKESPGIAQDEALAEVVGFLEACRPRMVDLVEAGMAGKLSEDLFEKCLKINDALLQTLEAERAGTGADLSLDLGEGEKGDAGGKEKPLIDLDGGGGSSQPLTAQMASFSISGGEDDDDDFAQLGRAGGDAAAAVGQAKPGSRLGTVPLKPAAGRAEPAAAGASAAATAPADEANDLDDFLNTITTGPSAASGGGGAGGAAEATDEADLEEFLKQNS